MKNGDFNSDVFSLKVYKGKTRFVSYFKNTIMPTLIYGFFIGVVVGVVVFGFNLMAEFLVEQSKEIYFYVSQHLQYLPVLLLGLAVLGFFSYLIAKLVPDSQGSGIPYTEGVMQGKIKFQPTEMAGAISSSAYLTFAGGLPLGGEGPSVTLGGVLGLFVNRAGQKAFKRGKEYERMSVTSGASAGLAVAFNAPLTGILFSLEEGSKKISAPIVLSCCTTVMFATLTSSVLNFLVCGEFRPLYFNAIGETMTGIDIQYIWMMLILGIVIGLCAAGFSYFQRFFRKFFKKTKMPMWLRIILSFLLIGVVGVFVPEVIGGGGNIITIIATNYTSPEQIATWFILVILILRLVIIGFSSNSGLTGGLFVPMLCLGALIGGLLGNLFILMGLPEESYSTVVAISMAAFMGAVSRAPLTAIVLIVEVTGEVSLGLLMMIFVIVISYMTIELTHVIPFYDELLEGIEERKYHNKKLQKFDLLMNIDEDSFVAGREIRDIIWPYGVSVTKIYSTNNDNQLVYEVPEGGRRILYPGDAILVSCKTYDDDETFDDLIAICSSRKLYDYKFADINKYLLL